MLNLRQILLRAVMDKPISSAASFCCKPKSPSTSDLHNLRGSRCPFFGLKPLKGVWSELFFLGNTETQLFAFDELGGIFLVNN